ncbi:MAG: hypothetical protein L6R39_007245 [Caloplaca ligustica]|nr:MAG: hypothetical protein L6R39_007245 [Caloplaca ligustica]
MSNITSPNFQAINDPILKSGTPAIDTANSKRQVSPASSPIDPRRLKQLKHNEDGSDGDGSDEGGSDEDRLDEDGSDEDGPDEDENQEGQSGIFAPFNSLRSTTNPTAPMTSVPSTPIANPPATSTSTASTPLSTTPLASATSASHPANTALVTASGLLNNAKSRAPTRGPKPSADRRHVTEHYVRYDEKLHGRNLPVVKFNPKNFSYKLFDSYPLYMDITNSDADGKWYPPLGCRLDDWNCAEALLQYSTQSYLANAEVGTDYPADFDVKNMLRATRNPLGNARKIWVTAGMVDGNGNTAGLGDQGYYYAWFRGLQPLMGKEGWDAGRYRVRPSGEKQKPGLLTWYLQCKCEVQLPVGHPDDPTFKPSTAGQLHGLVDKIGFSVGVTLARQVTDHLSQSAITQSSIGSLSSSVATTAADAAKSVAVSPDSKKTPKNRTKNKVLDKDGKVVEDRGKNKTKGKGKGHDRKEKASKLFEGALKTEIDGDLI